MNLITKRSIKLTVMPSGKYEYITYGVASGCFVLMEKSCKFKKFNFKRFYESIKRTLKSANVSQAMFVNKGC